MIFFETTRYVTNDLIREPWDRPGGNVLSKAVKNETRIFEAPDTEG